jgi:Polyketide cyclase / dehydrase and lipid transport
MATQVIDIVATTTASPATTYRLVADGATWPTWSPIGSFELERAGTGGVPFGEGVGAIRVFRTPQPVGPATTSREEVVEAVPGERFSYVLLSGLPVRKYRATIELSPAGEGTTIHWRSTFEGAFPGAGLVVRWALGRFIRQVVDGLTAYAPTFEPDGA